MNAVSFPSPKPLVDRRRFLECALSAASLAMLGPCVAACAPEPAPAATGSTASSSAPPFAPKRAWAASVARLGTQTIDQWLSATRTALEELSAHEHDSFYLGTPFGNVDPYGSAGPLDSWDCWHPNGRPKANGQAYMNCAGFIVAVLEACGCNCDRIGTYVSSTGYNRGNKANASRWRNFLVDHANMCTRFETKEDMLANGNLRKGDIVYAEPRNWQDPNADCHIMFFWGDAPDHDLAWHSSVHAEGLVAGTVPGNMISRICAKYGDCYWLHIPLKSVVEISLTKTSAQAQVSSGNGENPAYSLAGAAFSVYEHFENGKLSGLLAQFSTDAHGQAKVSLPTGKRVWISEDAAPLGFMQWKAPQALDVGNANSAANLEDEPCLVNVTIEKRDGETGARPQGWATLEGAVFELVDARGNAFTAATAYSAQSETWVASFSGAARGAARIREVKPPKGYVLSPFEGADEHGWKNIDLSPDSHEALATFALPAHENRVARANITGCKFAEAPDDPSIKNPLAGCTFAIWLQDDGSLAEKGYAVQVISNAQGNPVSDPQGNPLHGALMGKVSSHEDGRFTTQDLLENWDPGKHNGVAKPQGALPFGRYAVVETHCPNEALRLVEPLVDICVQEDGADVFLILEDKRISSPVRVVKTDAASGKPILAAGTHVELLRRDAEGTWQVVEFSAHYPADATISEFAVDETGCVQFPEALAWGRYAIRETRAVAPYVVREGLIEFEVSEHHDWGSSEIVEVVLPNEAADGRIEGIKADAQTSKGVAGATYTAYAAADIITPDGVVHAHANDPVGQATTDEEGCFAIGPLSLGRGTAEYLVRETESPTGYVLDEEDHHVTLSWENDRTAHVACELAISERPTEITVEKRDAATAEPIEGVEISVFEATAAHKGNSDAEGGGGDGGKPDAAGKGETESSVAKSEKAAISKPESEAGGAGEGGNDVETEDGTAGAGETVPIMTGTTNAEGVVTFFGLAGNATYRFVETAGRSDLGYVSAACKKTLHLNAKGHWSAAEEESDTADGSTDGSAGETHEDASEIQETAVSVGTITFENAPTEILVYKVDEAALAKAKQRGNAADDSDDAAAKALGAEAFLEGGQFELVDDTGKTVEAVTPEGKGATWPARAAQPQAFTHLVAGRTYAIREHAAPDGYEKCAAETTFTVRDTQEPQVVLVANKKKERMPQTGTMTWWPAFGAAAAVGGAAAFAAYSKRREALQRLERLQRRPRGKEPR